MTYDFVTNIASCYVDVPALLYYSHFPTAIIALLFGAYVLLKSRSFESWILFAMSILFAMWSIGDVILWLAHDSRIIMFVWSFINVLENLVSLLTLYFAYVLLKKRDAPIGLKMIALALFLPFLFVLPTTLNLSGFDGISCEAKEGPFVHYFYFLDGLFFLWILGFLIREWYVRSREDRGPVWLLAFGSLFFLLSFSGANILGSITGRWEILQYGLFGMPVFLIFLAYLIVRYKAFNMKLFGVQVLVSALIILIGAQLFFVKTMVNFFLTSSTFLIAVVFGIMLIRSVRQEIERKEELQTMADRLAVANDQLRKLDSSKSEFISIASHQLRTPLTAIKGFVSLLLEGSYGVVPGPISDVLNKIYTSNERIIQLVENLLSISRIESGKIQYEYADVRVEDMLSELRDTFMISAKKKELELVFDEVKTPLPLVWVDRQKALEVISNLIDNALKYTSAGNVTVRVEAVAGAVRVAVSDTGIGMSADTMPYLFVKFSRGKDVGRLHANGTGLGLYVGKQMIEAQGGRIWAESAGEGKGSTFFVELPVKRNANESVVQG